MMGHPAGHAIQCDLTTRHGLIVVGAVYVERGGQLATSCLVTSRRGGSGRGAMVLSMIIPDAKARWDVNRGGSREVMDAFGTDPATGAICVQHPSSRVIDLFQMLCPSAAMTCAESIVIIPI